MIYSCLYLQVEHSIQNVDGDIIVKSYGSKCLQNREVQDVQTPENEAEAHVLLVNGNNKDCHLSGMELSNVSSVADPSVKQDQVINKVAKNESSTVDDTSSGVNAHVLINHGNGKSTTVIATENDAEDNLGQSENSSHITPVENYNLNDDIIGKPPNEMLYLTLTKNSGIKRDDLI